MKNKLETAFWEILSPSLTVMTMLNWCIRDNDMCTFVYLCIFWGFVFKSTEDIISLSVLTILNCLFQCWQFSVSIGAIRIMVLGHRANMTEFTDADTFFWHKHKLFRKYTMCISSIEQCSTSSTLTKKTNWGFLLWSFQTHVAQTVPLPILDRHNFHNDGQVSF